MVRLCEQDKKYVSHMRWVGGGSLRCPSVSLLGHNVVVVVATFEKTVAHGFRPCVVFLLPLCSCH